MLKNILTTINLLLSIIVVYIIILLVYPYKTIEFKNDPFPVLTKEVKQGENLEFIAQYCKYTNTYAIINRSFVNDLIFTTSPIKAYRPKGCHTVNIIVEIPKELPKGTYHLVNRYEYQVNFLRTESVESETQEFTVK